MAVRELADHFAYSPEVIDQLARWAEGHNAAAVVCTCKDLVKISHWPGTAPLWALNSRLRILEGEAELAALLAPLAEKAKASVAAPGAVD